MPLKYDRCIEKVRSKQKGNKKKLNPYAICKVAVQKKIDNNKIIDKVWKKYKKLTNMTYNELLIWSKNQLSRKASLNRKPIKRNLKLLKKNKKDWTMQDIKQANKTISYLSRAKKIKSKNYVK